MGRVGGRRRVRVSDTRQCKRSCGAVRTVVLRVRGWGYADVAVCGVCTCPCALLGL